MPVKPRMSHQKRKEKKQKVAPKWRGVELYTLPTAVDVNMNNITRNLQFSVEST